MLIDFGGCLGHSDVHVLSDRLTSFYLSGIRHRFQNTRLSGQPICQVSTNMWGNMHGP